MKEVKLTVKEIYFLIKQLDIYINEYIEASKKDIKQATKLHDILLNSLDLNIDERINMSLDLSVFDPHKRDIEKDECENPEPSNIEDIGINF